MIRLFKVPSLLLLFLTIIRAGLFAYDWATFRWESATCEENAAQYLRKIGSLYSFNRCTQEIFSVEGTNRFLRRIYIVAGKVEKEWEFECGFFIDCSRYVAWSDDQGTPIEFDDPPSLVSEDLAVVSLGCAEDGMHKLPTPKLAIRDEAFAWLFEYRKYNTSTIYNTEIGCGCQVSGDVYHYHDRIVSSLKIDTYRKFIELDEKNLPIFQDFDLPSENRDFLKAISLGNPEPCRHSRSIEEDLRDQWHYLCARPREEFERQALADWDQYCEVIWDRECLRNYIAATGDTKICHESIKTDYPLDCGEIKLIKYTDRQQTSAALTRDPGETYDRRFRPRRVTAYEDKFDHPPFHW